MCSVRIRFFVCFIAFIAFFFESFVFFDDIMLTASYGVLLFSSYNISKEYLKEQSNKIIYFVIVAASFISMFLKLVVSNG